MLRQVDFADVAKLIKAESSRAPFVDRISDFNEERMERSPARKLIDEVVLMHGIGRK